jgi:hypothetical protein
MGPQAEGEIDLSADILIMRIMEVFLQIKYSTLRHGSNKSYWRFIRCDALEFPFYQLALLASW